MDYHLSKWPQSPDHHCGPHRSMLEKVAEEIAIMKKIDHPHVIRLHDVIGARLQRDDRPGLMCLHAISLVALPAQ